MKSYLTSIRKPSAADANSLGYVFARHRGHSSFEGVKWEDVKLPRYPVWSPATVCTCKSKNGKLLCHVKSLEYALTQPTSYTEEELRANIKRMQPLCRNEKAT